MCVSYLFKFVRFVEIRHLSTRQYVVDILKKSLLDNLRVGEQKDCGLVIDTRLVVQLSDICQESEFLCGYAASNVRYSNFHFWASIFKVDRNSKYNCMHGVYMHTYPHGTLVDDSGE
jgi:hypothetical protein